MKKVIHSKTLGTPTGIKQKVNDYQSSHKVCYIKWRDAFTETDEWHSSDTMTADDYVCETIGFLIDDNNSKTNYISIAGTVTAEGMYASIINIPKAMVITKKLIRFK